jgi:hypothetical protein
MMMAIFLTYEAKTDDGHVYECEGKYITHAVVNLALRYPELVGRWVEIGGVRTKVDPRANDSI